MAHIPVPPGAPGIIGPMMAYPETAKPLNELAELLLSRETPNFSKAERETVANYVSFLNQCVFCSESHAGVADYHWQKSGISKQVWESPEQAPISDRLRALLKIAATVQKSARSVSQEDIAAAKKLGSTDRDIHDTVLIAAAFCMYNRYVDGLGTFAPPRGDAAYAEMGKILATKGYVKAIEN
ncbi:carboxymuconolactone decarboxylase family protein [Bdellovibrio sp. HCB337]|uniref:carboxymuconolactone decarboxylase family protein n=1 Tax=Bdellovibrio sp. HCB337 TaxID=3394358 RepID=UPI0039A434F4